MFHDITFLDDVAWLFETLVCWALAEGKVEEFPPKPVTSGPGAQGLLCIMFVSA